MELPHLQRIYETYQDQGLKFVAIKIVPQQDEMVPEWKAQRGFEFPVLVGADPDFIISAYRLTGTPLNFLLDSEGKILNRWDGYYIGAESEIEAAVRKALAQG